MAHAQRAQGQEKAKAKAGNTAPPVQVQGAARPGDVAARAYEIWQQSGCPHGQDQEHWFRAEQELRARTAMH